MDRYSLGYLERSFERDLKDHFTEKVEAYLAGPSRYLDSLCELPLHNNRSIERLPQVKS
jgi:hypothetical protein